MFNRHASLPHVLHTAHCGDVYLAQVDPRARVVAAVVLSIAIAASHHIATMLVALAAAIIALALARLSLGDVLRRLLGLEIILLLVVLLLPWTARGGSPASVGPWGMSREGLMLAAAILLKANALVLGLMALVGTMDSTTFGHALSRLHLPRKLAHLFLFTIRYLDVLHREYRRLRAAMKVRCFRAQMNLHTYRVYGYLVGMLLVRSFDRSERVLAAMKCRGFRGRFYMLDHFAFSVRRDSPFCAAAMALLAALLLMEWAV